MKWITREHPKIDRIACPWLIKRFIDPDAQIIYVPYAEVLTKAAELDAEPFDVPGVEYTHYEDQCTFDFFIKKHELKDPALYRLAAIVRGADTDRHDFAPQSAGLEAIFSGLAFNSKDDQELLAFGIRIYDGLYSWAQHLYQKTHAQSGTIEQILLDVFTKYLQDNKRNAPPWAKELKNMIQDQIDTNMTLSLQQVSNVLEINPAYLSRAFARYFDDLSFGDYVRKLRIDKAVALIESNAYSLTEIAYLTGFSDQSHFTRIFKKQTGQSPSSYRKALRK